MGNHLKWASCCTAEIDCSDCAHQDECNDWYRYVDKHRSRKGYAHFDKRTSLADWKTRAKVLDPNWVSRHGFWPLIHVSAKRNRYVSDGKSPHLKKKVRQIRYCSHIDRCIYQRYAFLIDRAYNQAVAGTNIDQCAIAYRTNAGHDNIWYAKRAFDFIRESGRCVILATDFKDFFDTIDHSVLKKGLLDLLGCSKLPDDIYAVFKNATQYSDWPWKNLVELNGLTNCRAARKEMNKLETILTPQQFKDRVKHSVKKNEEGKGVPQGSPLSAVLSNVYLMNLDRAISNAVSGLDGLYLRYCDDAIIVLPVQAGKDDEAISNANELFRWMGSYPGVIVQEEKTARYLYESCGATGQIKEITAEGECLRDEAKVDYLGFTFNGAVVRMRAKAISKYHYRMRKKARSAAKQGKGKRNLYAVYSEKSQKINGQRNFVDYVRRARRSLHINDPASIAVEKHNMEKIGKMLRRFRR